MDKEILNYLPPMLEGEELREKLQFGVDSNQWLLYIINNRWIYLLSSKKI
jgi:hypothetical protein